MPLDPTVFQDLVDIYQGEIDSLIDNMGKPVVLYFKSTVTNVSQSVDDYVLEDEIRKPSFKLPSVDQPIETENTVTITALIKHNPADFQRYGLQIDDPQGIVRLKTYLTDVPNILKCEYAIVNADSRAIVENRYRLIRQPIPVGLKEDRYAISFWQRF